MLPLENSDASLKNSFYVTLFAKNKINMVSRNVTPGSFMDACRIFR